jgi:thiol-disulfide isomerase/thioredoxin
MKQISLIFVVAVLFGCFGADPEKTGKEGKPMPAFSMLLIDSSTWIHSQNIPIGKPTVLFYFSPYCHYCIAQTKTITENIDKLKNIQFYFISYFPLSAVKNFYQEYQLAKYPNITAGLDSSNFVNNYFEIPAFPYLAIYGNDKKLNKTFVGSIYSSQLIKASEE